MRQPTRGAGHRKNRHERMAREAGVPIKTFSVGFREAGYNELPDARRVAQWFGTEHHELMVEPQSLGELRSGMSLCEPQRRCGGGG